MTDEYIFLGVASVAKVEQLKSLVHGKNIRLEILYNQQSCSTGGCGMSVEVWVHPQDLPLIQEMMSKQLSQSLEGLDFDPNVVNQVFDPSKESAICPACGTQFSTREHECPDCGLVF